MQMWQHHVSWMYRALNVKVVFQENRQAPNLQCLPLDAFNSKHGILAGINVTVCQLLAVKARYAACCARGCDRRVASCQILQDDVAIVDLCWPSVAFYSPSERH